MVDDLTVCENIVTNKSFLRNSSMAKIISEQLAEQYDETRLIIEELLDDGSDPDALYTIEHHVASNDFTSLEQFTIEAFKLGFEVTDAEEMNLDDGSLIFCCDIISESALEPELIDRQVEQLITICHRFNVIYDGWGTYFEGDDNDAEDDNMEYDDYDDYEEGNDQHER